MNGDFSKEFKRLTNHDPFPWQESLGEQEECRNRLIRIPTGFGKTQGVLASWLFHRVLRGRTVWPTRLVWCLPMRVLVEQTAAEARRMLGARAWDGEGPHEGKVGVHILMGGSDAAQWHQNPEWPAVLIGTQDMLLSRALNRGYASSRARWPVEFGLLNQDCLWVMDEVQLMDVGLATSAQLQAFRDQDAKLGARRPCHTWWMSATLQPDWLRKSPETESIASTLGQELKCGSVAVLESDRTGALWEGVSKKLRLESCKDAKNLAGLIILEHERPGKRTLGPTLVVLNTVDRSIQVADELRLRTTSEVQLVHSRFRPREKAGWTEFLNREACSKGADRIIVATQVVEAGVDISAGVLVTELAPWPSLVQRFGRCARWGGSATVVVIDVELKKSAPYDEGALEAAREALKLVQDVAPLHLERFEEKHPDDVARLYPYDPMHLLLRREIEELFDTTPDLSGGDVDISRFIRTGNERDVLIFWREVLKQENPPDDVRPARDELCPAPFLSVREWLFEGKKGMRAWVWDWLDGRWRRADRRDVWPGQTLLVASSGGGYDTRRGWSATSSEPVVPVPPAIPLASSADDAQDDEALSASDWRTIATHGREVGAEAKAIAGALAIDVAEVMELAGRWHDAGKSHPAFQGSITLRSQVNPSGRQDLAKAPPRAWRHGRSLYPMPGGGRRPGFRHELASALALFAVLRRHRPDHPALVGPWIELFHRAGTTLDLAPASQSPPSALEREILDLDGARFDLLAYLVCSHHGKIRATWHSCPADLDGRNGALRIRGVQEGDVLPGLQLADVSGNCHELPETVLDLAPSASGLDPRTGPGWTERSLKLVAAYGPFRLAWLEACFRAADVRASRIRTPDPLITGGAP